MNVNGANAGFNAGLAAGIGMLADAAFLQLAAGVLAKRIDRLASGPFSQPMLPPSVTLTARSAGAEQPLAQWSATTTGAHTADIDLGDGYSLKVDERNSEMTIFNARTGENTRVWGDPHVDVDGKHVFDFWGTTTFQLENGTKLTINTEQWNGNPNMYVSSQVVITKGANSLVVDGISQNKLGDLQVTVGANGRALDAAHRDGFMLYENATGSSWRTEQGAIATQHDLDVTRPGQAYDPGAETPSLGEFFNILGGFLSTGRLPLDLAADRGTGERTAPRPVAQPRTPFWL
jgi:hypothetical protein